MSVNIGKSPFRLLSLCLILITVNSYGQTQLEPLNVPGGVALFELNWPSSSKEIPKAYYKQSPLLVIKHPQKPNHGWILAGIPLAYSGAHFTVNLHAPTSRDTRHRQVVPKQYPKEKIRSKRKHFQSPSPEIVKRIKEESHKLNAWLSQFDATRQPDLEFTWPAKGRLSSGFGRSRMMNHVVKSVHKGIDIAGPVGTLVNAASRGRVQQVEDLYYTGKTVIVDHGQGLKTLYCHLDHINVVQGQWVRKGDPLGTIGMTGRTTGPHLHFGVTLNVARVDPLFFLDGRLMKQIAQ